ncbi:FAD-dependent monooxygenase [Actinophytocola sp. NPDC049390]|uniref:FAD-dependent monooxygenase n=1 Tax=Actinophytocola sp. NPDC049390 TaxID=3363894 RepID=UPI00379732E4
MRGMRIDVIGGGPGGLFLARLLRLRDPATRVRVYERNGPDDAFGFGVVFSDRTMSSFHAADPHTHALIQEASVSWTDMEIRVPSTRLRYGGYGFTAISRRRLLRLLQDQATRAGAELCFHHTWSADPATDADLDPGTVLVIADGVNSVNREARESALGTSITTAGAKYVWFGTEAAFDAVTFPFVPTTFGTFAAHAYPFAEGLSTFIVEADERTWRASGMAEPDHLAPGETDDMSRKLLADIFSEHLGGHPLIGNNSRWNSFRVVRNDRWSTGGAVLLGDAAHTAHFSVGSGTKLAMEDAVALADALIDEEHRGDAFARYETRRRPAVARTQALADRSMRWWATFDRRMHLPPHRFGTHFITRTGAIDYAGLVRRHGDRIQDAEKEFARLSGRSARPDEDNGAPRALTTPLRLGSLTVDGRVAVRLPTAPSAHHWLENGYAAGADLLLADWRRAHAEVRSGAWRDTAVRMACRGASLGVLVDPAMIDETGRDTVVAAGARLVVLMCADRRALSSVDALIADLADTAAVCVGLACPTGSAWSAEGEEVTAVARGWRERGVAAVYLHGAEWEHGLAWADRIRTESRRAVFVDGPDGWALRVRGDGEEDWSTRLHVALVSGRADMVVAWPLGAPSRPAARAR